jgi:uncharacterized protein Yka (UPF0111/DUF47 family)
MRLLSALMPRERQFFVLFNQHAEFVVRGSRALEELLADFANGGDHAARIKDIEKIEHAADDVVHATMALMHRTFVTPFDRNDINRLIQRMDDIVDLIDGTAESLLLYDIRTITPEAIHLANLVQISCVRTQAAVALLSSMDNGPAILKLCEEIDSLESDADRVMRSGISKLFREEPDVRQVIKLKGLYELLETATDKCQVVAHILENMVLENA